MGGHSSMPGRVRTGVESEGERGARNASASTENTMVSTDTEKLKMVLGVFLASGVGAIGFDLLFSDNRMLWGGRPPRIDSVAYISIVAAIHGLLSVGVGYLTRRWWVALLGTWGGLFWGAFYLVLGAQVNSPWTEFVWIPAAVALGGLIGSGLGTRAGLRPGRASGRPARRPA